MRKVPFRNFVTHIWTNTSVSMFSHGEPCIDVSTVICMYMHVYACTWTKCSTRIVPMEYPASDVWSDVISIHEGGIGVGVLELSVGASDALVEA